MSEHVAIFQLHTLLSALLHCIHTRLCGDKIVSTQCTLHVVSVAGGEGVGIGDRGGEGGLEDVSEEV